MSKFKKGDRVRLISNDQFAHESVVALGSVGVVDQDASAFPWVVWDTVRPHKMDGDHRYAAKEESLQLINEGGDMKQPHRRTFKQLKDSISVRKDAIWQEACDDGTQEYILLDESFNKDPRQTQRIYDRSLVEDNSKHFVEVYKVSPEWQTKEEQEQWEAFKGRSKAFKKYVTMSGNYKKETISAPKKRQWTPAQRKAQSQRMKKYHAAKKAA